jgi:Asp-tRNA(Asn)/Glu-tRNA(Gln) amidotransferase C subunit
MEENALWHRVSEKEKEEIRLQAKRIMEEFANKLEKIKVDEDVFELGEGMRQESEPWKTPREFRDTMFANAPLVENDAIVAEKGGWK